MDSNQRRHSQRVYSPSLLTTQAPLRRHVLRPSRRRANYVYLFPVVNVKKKLKHAPPPRFFTSTRKASIANVLNTVILGIAMAKRKISHRRHDRRHPATPRPELAPDGMAWSYGPHGPWFVHAGVFCLCKKVSKSVQTKML